MSCACWTCVPQGTVQVIQAWGKFLKFAEPGCHCLVPCFGHEIAGALSTRIQSLDVAVETKTKDNVFVTIIVSTQYMVSCRDTYRELSTVVPAEPAAKHTGAQALSRNVSRFHANRTGTHSYTAPRYSWMGMEGSSSLGPTRWRLAAWRPTSAGRVFLHVIVVPAT